MGNVFTKLFDSMFNKVKDKRILMLGLDAAGKTTTLYKMKIGETVTTIPTIGFNVEEVTYKNINFTMWDVGGQEKLRPLWRHYYRGSNALIYIVDSADRERVEESRDELHAILSDPEFPSTASLLIFANKQDLPGALPPKDVADTMALNKLRREWYVQPSVAQNGDGLFEGLEWLVATLKKQKA